MAKTTEQRIRDLEDRNRRVEADKAWETSWVRRVAIAVLTYLVVSSYLYFVVNIDPWVNAIVPVVGFLLSTLTMSVLKTWWTERKRR